MTDKLKPVPCGCGGEAKTELTGEPFAPWIVKCPICGTRTELQDTEAEVITAWNTAMSGNAKAKLKAFWDGMSAEMKEERTAKATAYDPNSKSFWATDGRCEGCGCYLERKYNFCPMCGAKLEWE